MKVEQGFLKSSPTNDRPTSCWYGKGSIGMIWIHVISIAATLAYRAGFRRMVKTKEIRRHLCGRTLWIQD